MEHESEMNQNYFDYVKDPMIDYEESLSDIKSSTNSKKIGKWSIDEDDHLKKLVNQFGNKNWKKISLELQNKTPVQCLHRWTKILKPGLTKGPWSIEEDRKLIEWVRVEGPNRWSQCADYIKGRSGKQCRERWFNTLHPDVKKGNWTAEEDFIIFASFSKFGSKWSRMAKELPGRTENSIKNRFYSTLRRISTEHKKLKPSSVKSPMDYNSASIANSSLIDLLNYFPQALEEKTKQLSQHRQASLSASLTEDEPKFLHKKTSRNFKQPQTHINNTYNFNVNINSHLIEGLQPKNKIETNNFEDLENAIEKWCGDDFPSLADKSLENLEMKINKLISSDKFTNSQKNLNENLSTQINAAETDTKPDCISNLLLQLNELEKVLQMTKQELYNAENKNPDSGNQLDQLGNNLNNNINNMHAATAPKTSHPNSHNTCSGNLLLNDYIQTMAVGNYNSNYNLGSAHVNDYSNFGNLLNGGGNNNVNMAGYHTLTSVHNNQQHKSGAYEEFVPEEGNPYFLEQMFKI